MWHTQLWAFWFRTYLWISLNCVFLALDATTWKKVEEHIGTKTTNLIFCYMHLGIRYLIQELKLRTQCVL
jgi:hypothetical protein